MLLPRALAIRKSASSTRAQSSTPGSTAIAPDLPPLTSHSQSHLSAPTPGPLTSTLPNEPRPASSCVDSKSAPTDRLLRTQLGHPTIDALSLKTLHASKSSYPLGCIVWLDGLPIDHKVTKPVIASLVGVVMKIDQGSSSSQPPETLASISVTAVPNLTGNLYLKFIDFKRGLTSCHLRFSSPSSAARFAPVLNSLSGSPTPISIEISGVAIDCRKLQALIVSGRREAIYWERIPKYLHRSIPVDED